MDMLDIKLFSIWVDSEKRSHLVLGGRLDFHVESGQSSHSQSQFQLIEDITAIFILSCDGYSGL